MSTIDPYEDWPATPDDIRPQLSDNGPLEVREHFHLEAHRRLQIAEGSETTFELPRAADAFARSPPVRDAGELDPSELDDATIDMFVLAVTGVKPPNRYDERWLQAMRDTPPKTAAVLRSASFSFLTAWVQRYGPLRQDLDTRGTSVHYKLS